MASSSELEDFAAGVRVFLEPYWEAWHAERGLNPVIRSQWTCGRSSLFLHKALCSNAFEAEWVTGCPFDDHGNPVAAGFHHNGIWHGHSWVETTEFIIDITADQFGLAPVSVLPKKDARYCTSEDFSTAESKIRRRETAEDLWRIWHETVANPAPAQF